MYGPASKPIVTNLATRERISLDGVNLPTGPISLSGRKRPRFRRWDALPLRRPFAQGTLRENGIIRQHHFCSICWRVKYGEAPRLKFLDRRDCGGIRDHANARVTVCILLGNRLHAVGTGIVDDCVIPVGISLCQNALDALWKKILLVVGRSYDADQRQKRARALLGGRLRCNCSSYLGNGSS